MVDAKELMDSRFDIRDEDADEDKPAGEASLDIVSEELTCHLWSLNRDLQKSQSLRDVTKQLLHYEPHY